MYDGAVGLGRPVLFPFSRRNMPKNVHVHISRKMVDASVCAVRLKRSLGTTSPSRFAPPSLLFPLLSLRATSFLSHLIYLAFTSACRLLAAFLDPFLPSPSLITLQRLHPNSSLKSSRPLNSGAYSSSQPQARTTSPVAEYNTRTESVLTEEEGGSSELVSQGTFYPLRHQLILSASRSLALADRPNVLHLCFPGRFENPVRPVEACEPSSGLCVLPLA